MERKINHINISAPNLVNICVDQEENGELSGRYITATLKTVRNFSI